jgi:hypothetical protein
MESYNVLLNSCKAEEENINLSLIGSKKQGGLDEDDDYDVSFDHLFIESLKSHPFVRLSS